VNKEEKIILGIDPGTNLMGYGVISVKGQNVRLVCMGIIDLKKLGDHYIKLAKIFEKVTAIIDQYHPDELAIEAPFFGKNVQSMLKLGRAQGVAMAACLARQIPIFEYSPRKVKMAITGQGASSKEQVAAMLKNILKEKELPQSTFDATDALGIAVCHFFQSNKPDSEKSFNSWADFISKNPARLKK